MKVYISGLITNAKSMADAFEYFETREQILRELGYTTLSPMSGKNKEYLLSAGQKADGYTDPVTNRHAIMERDRWMVQTSDVVYCNLTGAPAPSIGCTMELAWAHQLGKHTILVMEKGNVHEHSFIFEAADIHFYTEKEALDYLARLI